MIIIYNVIKFEILFSDTKVYIQNSNSLYTSYFYYTIKTCIW